MFVKWMGIASITAVSLVAAGCGHRGYGEFDPAKARKMVDRRVNDTLDDLKATDAQKAQVRGVVDRVFPKALAMKDEGRAAREEAVALWSAATLDRNAARAMVDKRIDALRAFGYEIADSAAEVHAILSPEQRAQLTELAKEHHGCGR